MFFQKKSHPEEESVAKKGVKKMDTLVTGILLGGVIASIYGVKKLREKPDHDDHVLREVHEEDAEIPHAKTRKRGILSRIFFGNK